MSGSIDVLLALPCLFATFPPTILDDILSSGVFSVLENSMTMFLCKVYIKTHLILRFDSIHLPSICNGINIKNNIGINKQIISEQYKKMGVFSQKTQQSSHNLNTINDTARRRSVVCHLTLSFTKTS